MIAQTERTVEVTMITLAQNRPFRSSHWTP